MTRNIQAQEKLYGFIDKLASLGYRVIEVHKKPQIYSINGELVNIRIRGKSKETADGSRRFWYSVSFSVLQDVKWVIYMTTGSDYFVMLPSSFLESLKDRMYPDRKRTGVGVFDIDWDNMTIDLKQGERISIDDYYHNLIHLEDYPRFVEYLKHFQKNDLVGCAAQTDVKSDRSLRPHQQPDPDMYLRIVEKKKEGVIVRGAKAHNSIAAYADEIIVTPTRALTK